MGLDIYTLSVANYMTPYPIKTSKAATFGDAANLMANHGIGNLVVTHTKNPVGIVTERELIQCAALWPSDFYDKQLSKVGYQKFTRIDPTMSVLKAAKTMIRKKTRLLVFDGAKMVGIITASDMLRAFRKADDSPKLDKVISTKLFRCSQEDSVLTAINMMNQKKIGSVLVGNKNTGIFTERDLLVHVFANNIDLSSPVGGYATYPFITARYGISALEAASIMAQNNTKRLGLTRNGVVIGMVTARDIIDAYQSTYPTSDPYLEK